MLSVYKYFSELILILKLFVCLLTINHLQFCVTDNTGLFIELLLNTILKNLLIRWTLHIEIQGLSQEDINHSIKEFRKQGGSL